jgi:hypothetical protein
MGGSTGGVLTGAGGVTDVSTGGVEGGVDSAGAGEASAASSGSGAGVSVGAGVSGIGGIAVDVDGVLDDVGIGGALDVGAGGSVDGGAAGSLGVGRLGSAGGAAGIGACGGSGFSSVGATVGGSGLTFFFFDGGLQRFTASPPSINTPSRFPNVISAADSTGATPARNPTPSSSGRMFSG